MHKNTGPSRDGPVRALRLVRRAIGIPEPDGGVGLAVFHRRREEGHQAEVFHPVTPAGLDSAELFTSHFFVPLSFILIRL